MLHGYVEDRRKAPEGLGSDAIDVLIEQGVENSEIIQVQECNIFIHIFMNSNRVFI